MNSDTKPVNDPAISSVLATDDHLNHVQAILPLISRTITHTHKSIGICYNFLTWLEIEVSTCSAQALQHVSAVNLSGSGLILFLVKPVGILPLASMEFVGLILKWDFVSLEHSSQIHSYVSVLGLNSHQFTFHVFNRWGCCAAHLLLRCSPLGDGHPGPGVDGTHSCDMGLSQEKEGAHIAFPGHLRSKYFRGL